MAAETRTTLVLAATSIAYVFAILHLDTDTTLAQQIALGVAAWVYLGIILRFSPPSQRVQVLTMIGVATTFECIGSLIWGAYRYRLENIPLYVPPGHGIFFFAAVRLSELPWIDRHRRAVVGTVFAGSIGLLVRGILFQPAPDLLGLVTWLMLLWFLFCGTMPAFYAISFTITMTLEFWGTAHGNWAWAPLLPFVGLSAANPPFGVGGAYCAMDAIARRLAPSVGRAMDPVRSAVAPLWARCRLAITGFRRTLAARPTRSFETAERESRSG